MPSAPQPEGGAAGGLVTDESLLSAHFQTYSHRYDYTAKDRLPITVSVQCPAAPPHQFCESMPRTPRCKDVCRWPAGLLRELGWQTMNLLLLPWLGTAARALPYADGAAAQALGRAPVG